ncbi:MAG: hypothetical protein HY291_12580 [Planctomycetes bacterium]|nr:hypothetical protein [Planctomycetota bacterium]
MLEPRKRRWFQIHLSAAIVLMLAASLLLYVNIRPPRVIPETVLVYRPQPGSPSHGMTAQFLGSGWPFHNDGGFATPALPEDGEDPVAACQKELDRVGQGRPVWERYNDSEAVVLNALFGFALLAAMGVLLEYLVRCREAGERPRIPLRPATGLILLAVTGMLAWANLRSEAEIFYQPNGALESQCLNYGWPVTAFAKFPPQAGAGPGSTSFVVGAGWHRPGILIDFFAGIAVLGLTGVPTEYILRRREARKP